MRGRGTLAVGAALMFTLAWTADWGTGIGRVTGAAVTWSDTASCGAATAAAPATDALDLYRGYQAQQEQTLRWQVAPDVVATITVDGGGSSSDELVAIARGLVKVTPADPRMRGVATGPPPSLIESIASG